MGHVRACERACVRAIARLYVRSTVARLSNPAAGLWWTAHVWCTHVRGTTCVHRC